MDENLISFEDVDFLSKMLKQATQEEFQSSTEIDWKKLQISAQHFIKSYNILIQNEVLQKKQIYSLLVQSNPESSNFFFKFQGQHKDAYFTRAKYLLAFDFDAQLTAYLGQVPKEAIYVIWDSRGKRLRSFKMSMRLLASLVSAEGRLNFTAAMLKREGAEEIEKNSNTILGIEQQHIVESQSAYRGTVNRLNQYYNKKGVKWTQRKNGLLMWKEANKWIVANVNSYGDAKEGYIAALMTKHEANIDALFNLSIGDERYYDDILIKNFYTHFITGVTNKAAIREEDVVTENGQYAIKSMGASMPSFDQYLNVAKQICSSQIELSPEQLSKEIEQLYPADAARNHILGSINEFGEYEINQLLSNQGNGILSNDQKEILKSLYI